MPFAPALAACFVADAAKPRLELGAALAGEDQVRVAIDQSLVSASRRHVVHESVSGPISARRNGVLRAPAQAMRPSVHRQSAVRDRAIGGCRSAAMVAI